MRIHNTGSIRMQSKHVNNRKNVIRGIILVFALILVGAGLKNQGFMDVMHKAILICYECIGIG